LKCLESHAASARLRPSRSVAAGARKIPSIVESPVDTSRARKSSGIGNSAGLSNTRTEPAHNSCDISARDQSRLKSIVQLLSQVFPASSGKAGIQRAESAPMKVEVKHWTISAHTNEID
jgi:hypothetical protein